MGGLSSYAWRSLAARPLRSLLTVVGVALGVAVLFTALTTNAGIEAAIGRTVGDLIGRAGLRVEGFTERGLSAASLTAIDETPGVDVTTPVLERKTYLAPDPLAPPAPTLPAPVTVLGIDPATYPQLSTTWTSPPAPAWSRRMPAGALITERMARETGLRLGSTLALQGAGEPRSEPIVGILTGDGPLATTDGRTVLLALAEARAVFGHEGVSRVDVGLGPVATPDAVAAALDERLPHEPYVLSTPTDLAASIRASTIDFQATTALIAALALFGGAFLIFNTLSMTVAERAREVGLLRAAGATRRQVNGLVLVQALIIGVAGGAARDRPRGRPRRSSSPATSRSAADRPDRRPGPRAVLGAPLALVVGIRRSPSPRRSNRPIGPGASRPSRRFVPTGAGRTVRARLRWLVVVFAVVAVSRSGPLAERDRVGAGTSRWLGVYGSCSSPPWSRRSSSRPSVRSPPSLPAGRPGSTRLTRGIAPPRPEPDDADRRGADRGAGDDRRPRRRGPRRAAGGDGVDRRRRAGRVIVPARSGRRADEPGQAELAASPGVARVSPLATFEVAFRGVRLDVAAVVGRRPARRRPADVGRRRPDGSAQRAR